MLAFPKIMLIIQDLLHCLNKEEEISCFQELDFLSGGAWKCFVYAEKNKQHLTPKHLNLFLEI
jgi:hypothetical protein